MRIFALNLMSMILSSTVYSAVLDSVRADRRGLTLSEDEYNRLAPVVCQRVFAIKYKEFETSTSNISSLAPFKVINHGIALGGAECPLPANYKDMIGKPRITDADGVTRRCDLVSELELAEREDDYLTQPTETHPLYTLGELDATNTYIILHVYPVTIVGTIYVDYLRQPEDPYLDYYMSDTTYERTYLADGATAVNIPSGYTYRDKTTGGPAVFVNSHTQDWEFEDGDMPLILAIFAEMIGIALPDEGLVQTGNLEEQKNS